MSISLLVTSERDQESQLIPVTTQQDFVTFWLPRCAALGLRFVPLFESGIPIDTDDIPYIINELLLFKQSLQGVTTSQFEAGILDRVDRLIEALKAVAGQKNLKIWIG